MLELATFLLAIFLLLALKKLYEVQKGDQSKESGLLGELSRKADYAQKLEYQISALNLQISALRESRTDPNQVVAKSVYNSEKTKNEAQIVQLTGDLAEVTENLKKERGSKKSEQVRLGLVSENFAPFLDRFPYDRSKVKALFQPIDLIYFGEDEIVFIDVKSGNSQLSTKQRRLRDLVREKKVRFEIHQVNEKGYVIKE